MQPAMSLTKTCQNCFRAKIRCDRTQSNDACDRCHRLRKQCVFRPSTRRYNSQMRDSRIEALEAQVRELLGSGRTASSSGNSLSPEPQPAPASDPDDDAIDQGLLSMQQADVLVNIFKTRLTPHFPFVVLPAHVSAAQLRFEKPFLFLAVLAAASFDDMPVQRQLGHLLKQAVNERILASGSLTFEVLQGLLVYLAWSHYHTRPRLYSQYLQLAVSIVVDLRLDREPVAARKTYAGSHRNPLTESAQPSRSADEQRAAAGCFYLSSTIANLLQKLNTIPYTDYMAECCMSLATRAEAPTDKYLYYMVRLQHIIESIDFMTSQQQHQPMVDDEAATNAAIYAVQAELGALRASLPFELSESTSLLMQFHTAELFLCQAALVDWDLLAAPSSSSSGTPSSSAGSPLHLDVLCAGLSAGKSLLDAYLTLPIRAETAFNNSEWIQLSFGLTVAARLAVASTTVGSSNLVTDQQKQAVSTMSQLRAALSISNALRAIAQRVGALGGATNNNQTDAPQQGESGANANVFAQYEQRIRRIQQWFEVLSAPARREQLQQLNRTRSSSNVSHCRSRSRSHSPLPQQPPTGHHQPHPSSSSTSSSSFLQPSSHIVAEPLPMSMDFTPSAAAAAADPHHRHHQQSSHHHHPLGAMSYPPPSSDDAAAAASQQSLLPDFPLDFLMGEGNGTGSGAHGCGGNGDWMYPHAGGGTDWLI